MYNQYGKLSTNAFDDGGAPAAGRPRGRHGPLTLTLVALVSAALVALLYAKEQTARADEQAALAKEQTARADEQAAALGRTIAALEGAIDTPRDRTGPLNALRCNPPIGIKPNFGEAWRTWSTEPAQSGRLSGAGHIDVAVDRFPAAQLAAATDAITLTTQSDITRVAGRAVLLAGGWAGPVSYAVLVTQRGQAAAEQVLLQLHETNQAVRQHVSFHLCVAKRQWDLWPSNFLRNVAKNASRSEYTMILDSDEGVSADMRTHLAAVKAAAAQFAGDKVAFIVRSFQWLRRPRGAATPRGGQQLRGWAGRGAVHVKQHGCGYNPDGWVANDAATHGWLNMTRAIDHTGENCPNEPYFVAKARAVPDFDTRFVGWGGNKNSLWSKMRQGGWKAVLLPRLYTFGNETMEEQAAGLKQTCDRQRELGCPC